jgi:hypothetical protein
MSLRSRVAALEAKRGGDGLITVIVGGGCPLQPGQIEDVRPGESFDDHCARRQAEARAAGQKVLLVYKFPWERTPDEHGSFSPLVESKENER